MPLRPSRKPAWTTPQRWLPLAGATATPSWHWEAVAHLWRSSASSVAVNRARPPCYATVGWQRRICLLIPLASHWTQAPHQGIGTAARGGGCPEAGSPEISSRQRARDGGATIAGKITPKIGLESSP